MIYSSSKNPTRSDSGANTVEVEQNVDNANAETESAPKSSGTREKSGSEIQEETSNEEKVEPTVDDTPLRLDVKNKIPRYTK